MTRDVQWRVSAHAQTRGWGFWKQVGSVADCYPRCVEGYFIRHGIEIEKYCVQGGIHGDLTRFVSIIDNYDIFT